MPNDNVCGRDGCFQRTSVEEYITFTSPIGKLLGRIPLCFEDARKLRGLEAAAKEREEELREQALAEDAQVEDHSALSPSELRSLTGEREVSRSGYLRSEDG